jgi:hypothetical protein
MKNVTIILMALVGFQWTTAQDCTFYYPQQEGATLEYSHYNKRDKLTGKTIHEISNVVSSDNSMSATVNVKTYDDKGEQLAESELNVRCEDGVFYMDMKNFMSQEMMEGFQDMEITMNTEDLELPSNLKVGDNLKDGWIKMVMQGPMTMTFSVNVKDRRVEAREKITTAAGTFNCFKLAQTVETKTPITVTSSSKEWYAEDIGMVRSESYSKNGKLTGYSLLTLLNR